MVILLLYVVSLLATQTQINILQPPGTLLMLIRRMSSRLLRSSLVTRR
ncbi:hypothetical protein Hdeb2414_s0027g00697001 [Helianthus debilis subsp. tardiflorus]